MAYNHGMAVEEKDTSVQTTISEGTLPLYVGTAPVHLATEPKINEVVICYNQSDYAKYFGYNKDHNFTLNKVADIFFKYEGIAPVAFINVFDPMKHMNSQTAKALALVSGVGVESVSGIIFNSLKVSLAIDMATLLVEDTDYYVTLNSDGYLEITMDSEYNEGALPEKLYIKYDTVDTTKVTTEDIVGYADAEGNKTGLELVDTVYTEASIVPSILAVPKYSSEGTVASIMKTKANNLNVFYKCMALIDCPQDLLYSKIPAWKKLNGITDPCQFVLYGLGTIGDYYYEPSILIGAQMCRVDIDNDDCPCESPSNKSLPIDGAIRIVEGSKISLKLGYSEANYLNSQGITTIWNSPNGWVSWGNYTACYPSNIDPKDYTINWKRMLFYYRKVFIQTLFSHVDAKVNKQLLELVCDTFNQYFNLEVSAGHILSGKMSYLTTENTVANLISGKIIFTMVVTFSPNAQYIVGTIEVDVASLTTLLAA